MKKKNTRGVLTVFLNCWEEVSKILRRAVEKAYPHQVAIDDDPIYASRIISSIISIRSTTRAYPAVLRELKAAGARGKIFPRKRGINVPKKDHQDRDGNSRVQRGGQNICKFN